MTLCACLLIISLSKADALSSTYLPQFLESGQMSKVYHKSYGCQGQKSELCETFFGGPCGRLRAVRERLFGRRGMNAFAKLLGIPFATYHGYESGRSPIPAQLAQRVENATGADKSWLLYGESSSGVAASDAVRIVAESGEAYGRWKASHGLDAERLENQVVAIPILGGAVAAGSPREVDESEIEDWAFCYRPHVSHPMETSAVRVVGASMEPYIGDGGLVGIDHADRDVVRIMRANPPLCAVRDVEAGGVLVRSLRQIRPGLFAFEPANPGPGHVGVVWDAKRDSENPIVGRVVWIYRQVT